MTFTRRVWWVDGCALFTVVSSLFLVSDIVLNDD